MWTLCGRKNANKVGSGLHNVRRPVRAITLHKLVLFTYCMATRTYDHTTHTVVLFTYCMATRTYNHTTHTVVLFTYCMATRTYNHNTQTVVLFTYCMATRTYNHTTHTVVLLTYCMATCTYNHTTHSISFLCFPVRIRVRIDPPHPLVCRKRRLNGPLLRMRPEKPRPRVTAGVAQ
jgi:hypothetical protein